MAELIFLYGKRDTVGALTTPCLITGQTSLYPSDRKPEEDEIEIVAQWDTGATMTVVAKSILDALGREPNGGKRNIVGSNGVYQSDTYTVNLYLPDGIVFENLLVVEMKEEHSTKVLIGLDVILQSDFVIEPQGENAVLKFRYPPEGNKPFTAIPIKLFREEE